MAANPSIVWLEENDKEPFASDRFWYWFAPAGPYKNLLDDERHELPPAIYDRLCLGDTSWEGIKMYLTREAAIKDFQIAFWAAARAEELQVPEPRGSPYDESEFRA